jgi:hypothetical protein
VAVPLSETFGPRLLDLESWQGSTLVDNQLDLVLEQHVGEYDAFISIVVQVVTKDAAGKVSIWDFETGDHVALVAATVGAVHGKVLLIALRQAGRHCDVEVVVCLIVLDRGLLPKSKHETMTKWVQVLFNSPMKPCRKRPQ